MNGVNINRTTMPEIPGMLTLFEDNVPTLAALRAVSQPSALELQNVVDNNAAQDNSVDDTRPQLAQPTGSAAQQIANKDSLLGLIAQLMEVFDADKVESMKARLHAFNQFAEARKLQLENASKAYLDAKKELDNAASQLENATSQLGRARQELDGANALVDKAKQAYSKAELAVAKAQKVVDAAPGDPEALQALEDAQKALQKQQQELSHYQQQSAQAQRKYDAASVAVGRALDATNAAMETVLEFLADLDNVPAPVDKIKEIESTIKVLMQCMLALQELMGKDTQNALDNRIALFKMRNDSIREQLKKDAKAYTEAQENAKRISKISTLVTKIIGWLLTALGLISSVFTGGIGGILLASAGMAIMVADEILSSKGEKTASEIIMGPIMEKVIMPFIQVIAQAIEKQMIKDGFSKEAANITAYVLASVTAAFTLVAGGAIAFKAVGSLLGALSKSLLPTFLRDGFTKVSIAMKDFFQELVGGPHAMEKLLNVIEIIQAFLVPVLLGVQGGMDMKVAADRKKALEFFADMSLLRRDLTTVKEGTETAMQEFKTAIKIPHEFIKIFGQVIESNGQMAKKVMSMRV